MAKNKKKGSSNKAKSAGSEKATKAPEPAQVEKASSSETTPAIVLDEITNANDSSEQLDIVEVDDGKVEPNSMEDELKDKRPVEAKEVNISENTNTDVGKELSDITTQNDVERVREERDQYELKYNTLLSKISSMKTVFSQMKQAQQELEDTREQLNEYENQNINLKQRLNASDSEIKENKQTISTLNEEIVNLNKECENLSNECTAFKHTIKGLESSLHEASNQQTDAVSTLNSEIRSLKSQIESLEIIINNEKQDKRDLEEQISDYKQQLEQNSETKKQLGSLISDLEKQLSEKNTAIETISKQRSTEVDQLSEKITLLSKSNEEKSSELDKLREKVQDMNEDVALKAKFEQEAKERVLQIGKLRHEAIILNEHLTKALAMLKRNNDSESVDKELISNLFISFVTIPRGDPKKFEVLELISSFLNWDTDKNTQAGIIQNPNHTHTESRTQNFVSLWTEFLEKESEK
ncbi:unnamed protein product [Kluyveromyces dobzhanskii CBS 2104]|uniref:WGS project CCBQ000000000 data, contig 00104 n=1 Tax=Kluyveromyces dobzhanskii CBS 2104 TaxID=1427455 RepID=A0A0A8L5W1_9SACH|nr:unnamed protein product [Kluyveromyces dobzhanskii CBS 2104]